MFFDHFQDLSKAFQTTTYANKTGYLSESSALEQIFNMLQQVQDQQGIAYVIGNGGSAGIASHFSTDLIKALKIPSATLYDSNIITCLSNDYGYEEVFSYPLERLLKPNDLLVAISSSGQSSNILKAVETALRKSVKVITLSGFLEQNPLRSMGDLNVWVDRCHYGFVEMSHFIILHTIVDLWNQQSKVKEYAEVFRS